MPASFDPGFDAARLAIIDFNMEDVAYDEARGRAFRQLALETAAAVPGVDSASLAQDPFFWVSLQRFVLLGGRDNQSAGRPTLTGLTWPGYFQTSRIPFLQGRDFSLREDQAAPHVAIVNETAARLFWPGEDPLGKTLQFVGDQLPAQVIGVVRTVNYRGIGEAPQPVIYLSMQQFYRPVTVVVIHTPGDPAAAGAAVRRQLQKLEPNLPVDSAERPHHHGESALGAENIGQPAGSVWLPGPAAGDRRDLWRDLLYRKPARPRDWRAHGLGRHHGGCGAHGADARNPAGGDGLALGLGVALAACRLVESMLPATDPHDAVTFILVPSDSRAGGGHGLLAAGAAGRTRRSGPGAAQRVGWPGASAGHLRARPDFAGEVPGPLPGMTVLADRCWLLADSL